MTMNIWQVLSEMEDDQRLEGGHLAGDRSWELEPGEGGAVISAPLTGADPEAGCSETLLEAGLTSGPGDLSGKDAKRL